MINQTMYVNNLKERMNTSLELEFYLESITCSYAIIENRTKRICEHLGKSARDMNLYDKTKFIYDSIKQKTTETDKTKKKLIGFLEYRIINANLLDLTFSDDFSNLNKSVTESSVDNPLIVFRKSRNNLIHELATYDSSDPKLINFNDYEELAILGKNIANELCRISSRLKEKKKRIEV